MFSHVMLGADDLDASIKFYDATLSALGQSAGKMDPKGRYFYRTDSGVFALTRPLNGEAASGANGGTIGFAATSEEQVNDWHAAGCANGGSSCEDPPGYREMPTGKLYLAYLNDPSGNKICALYRP